METIILYVKGMFTVALVKYGNNYIIYKGNVSSSIIRIKKQLYYTKGMFPVSLVEYGNNYTIC